MLPPPGLDSWIRALSLFGAVVAFGWGVYQFVATQSSQAETKRIEATRPFLERQLKLYTEATQAAATLSTSKDVGEIEVASKKFWSLYWENSPWSKTSGSKPRWFESAVRSKRAALVNSSNRTRSPWLTHAGTRWPSRGV